jgi:hypothetical protein
MISRKFLRELERAAILAGVTVLVALLALPLPAIAAAAQAEPTGVTDTAASSASSSPNLKAPDRFCANSDCAKTRQTFRKLCDWIVKNRPRYHTIYVGGYYMRDLVAGYEIFGDRKYLDTAIAYGDYLLKMQMPNGFWATGYGAVYLADTGTAVGLFAVLYKHVDPARQKKYVAAVKRYTDAIQAHHLILPNGAFASGWDRVKDGKMSKLDMSEYTLSSTLTGAVVYTWMYHMTKEDRYRQVAHRALKWIFSTMSSDGNIPYIEAAEGGNWAKRGSFTSDEMLWSKMTYGTSGYVGEGVIAFDLYCGNPAWQKWIQKAVRPNIEFLLRNQLPDGTWSRNGRESWDRTRGTTVVNYLIWYYDHVDPDPRIQNAVQRFDAFITNPENGKSYGMFFDGATGGNKADAFNSGTSITGRALADILKPGVDTSW